jgi:hypothetical protein
MVVIFGDECPLWEDTASAEKPLIQRLKILEQTLLEPSMWHSRNEDRNSLVG